MGNTESETQQQPEEPGFFDRIFSSDDQTQKRSDVIFSKKEVRYEANPTATGRNTTDSLRYTRAINPSLATYDPVQKKYINHEDLIRPTVQRTTTSWVDPNLRLPSHAITGGDKTQVITVTSPSAAEIKKITFPEPVKTAAPVNVSSPKKETVKADLGRYTTLSPKSYASYLSGLPSDTIDHKGQLSPSRVSYLPKFNFETTEADRAKINEIVNETLRRTYTAPNDTRVSVNRVSSVPNINDGYIRQAYDDGSYYEGGSRNGKRHGRGKLTYANGMYYDGEFFDGSLQGRGRLFFKNGLVCYDGEFFDDKFHGKGVLSNANPAYLRYGFNYRDFSALNDYWVKYEGEFRRDYKNGLGTLYLSNGEKFVGEWADDKVSGRGTYYTLDRGTITGRWENGKLLDVFA